MDVDHFTDIEIINRIVAGEKSFYKTLVERHQDFAFTLAFRILKNRGEAEDAAQDAFIKAFQSLGSFKKESKFSTWLYRIVCNTAISYQRKWKSHESIDIEKTGHEKMDGTRDQVEYGDRKKFVQQALSRLTKEETLLITLFYFKDQKMEEIARIASLNINTTKVKLLRARKKMGDELRSILKEEVLNL